MNHWKRSTLAITTALLAWLGTLSSNPALGQETHAVSELFRAESNQSKSAKEAPAVLIRPSVADPNHINECVIEITEIPNSDSEIALRLMVPDSVQRIEVIPNRGAAATRNFRLRLDQGSPQEQSRFDIPKMQPTSLSPSAQTQLPLRTAVRPGFKKNPFMDQHVAQLPKPHLASLPSQPEDGKMLQPVFYNNLEQDEVPTVIQADSTTPATDFLTTQVVAQPMVSELPISSAANFLPPIVAGNGSKLTSTQLIGPTTMGVGDIADFTIAVAHPTKQVYRELKVTLTIPEGLNVVILDRQAKFDHATNTLTWSISGLQAREETLIHYRVKSETQGKKQQQISITADKTSTDGCKLTTDVQLRYSTPETPSLQYEPESE